MTAPPIRHRTSSLWDACWRGDAPAEALPPGWRDQLVYELWSAGWTDQQIADHTRMTLYTAARIRDRMGLTPGGA